MEAKNMSMLEHGRVIGGIMPISKAASATQTSQYVSLKGINKLGIIVAVGAGTGTFNIELLQATAVAGTGAKALSFSVAEINTTASSTDVFTKTTVASDIMPLTANDLALITIDPSKLDINNDFDCVAVKVTESGGAAAQLVTVLFQVISGKVMSRDAAPSAVAD